MYSTRMHPTDYSELNMRSVRSSSFLAQTAADFQGAGEASEKPTEFTAAHLSENHI